MVKFQTVSVLQAGNTAHKQEQFVPAADVFNRVCSGTTTKKLCKSPRKEVGGGPLIEVPHNTAGEVALPNAGAEPFSSQGEK